MDKVVSCGDDFTSCGVGDDASMLVLLAVGFCCRHDQSSTKSLIHLLNSISLYLSSLPPLLLMMIDH